MSPDNVSRVSCPMENGDLGERCLVLIILDHCPSSVGQLLLLLWWILNILCGDNAGDQGGRMWPAEHLRPLVTLTQVIPVVISVFSGQWWNCVTSAPLPSSITTHYSPGNIQTNIIQSLNKWFEGTWVSAGIWRQSPVEWINDTIIAG